MMDLPLNVDFTGKVVVITGAGGVICSTMARAFAQAGAKVAAINRTGIKVEKLAEELRAEGFICNGYEGNVLDKERMEEIHEQVLAEFGPCDILINGAGGNNPRDRRSGQIPWRADGRRRAVRSDDWPSWLQDRSSSRGRG